eukprot:scaffold201487_cov28-Tisochrysis_lutea.AAC.4
MAIRHNKRARLISLLEITCEGVPAASAERDSCREQLALLLVAMERAPPLLRASSPLAFTRRICECDQEAVAVKRRERKEAQRLNPRPKSAHEALGRGLPKHCLRFLQGLCLRNKLETGRPLQSLPRHSGGAWYRQPKCTIRCRLHPHKKIPGVCLNGPACLFLHPECRVRACHGHGMSHPKYFMYSMPMRMRCLHCLHHAPCVLCEKI